MLQQSYYTSILNANLKSLAFLIKFGKIKIYKNHLNETIKIHQLISFDFGKNLKMNGEIYGLRCTDTVGVAR